MTIKNKQNKGSVTRSQLALIGVLVAVLVIVIVVQMPDSSEAPLAIAKNSPLSSAKQSTETLNNQIQKEQEQRVVREWPHYNSEQLVRLDPLSTPAWYNSILEVVEQKENSSAVTEAAHDLQLQELQDTGTGIVLIAGSERIAKVGDTHVRVGDKIDGYEVSNITSQGVILTKSKSR